RPQLPRNHSAEFRSTRFHSTLAKSAARTPRLAQLAGVWSPVGQRPPRLADEDEACSWLSDILAQVRLYADLKYVECSW
ncbi:hypothetical protein EJB05_39720, partial [Eragrostis curvula]